MNWLPISIGAYPVVLAANTLNINWQLEGRQTASFDVIDLDGSDTYTDGQIVEIESNGELIFSGVIQEPESERLSPSGGLLHHIQCIDWHYLADKRLAAESYVSQSAGDIATDLFTKYLEPEGVTIGQIDEGATVGETVINYVPASDAFTGLAERAGFIWFIDKLKQFYFVPRETFTAPFTLTPAEIYGTARLKRGNPLYRNRQFVRGIKAVTDTQNEIRMGDGETQAFALGFPIAKVPTVTVNTAPQTVGIKGVEEGKQVYWNKGDNTIYFATAPASGATIGIAYQGEYNLITRSDDRHQIEMRKTIEGGEGTGYVDAIEDITDLTTKEAGFEAGANLLDKYAQEGRRLTFQTFKSGLQPGQILTVNYPLLGLDSDELLITSVSAYDDNNYLVYEIEATEGPDLGDWTQFFKSLADKRISIDRISLGEDSTLVILVEKSGVIGITENVDVTVHACPVPSPTLYPSSALLPC